MGPWALWLLIGTQDAYSMVPTCLRTDLLGLER
jgi:hypothetical protein